MIVFGVAVWGRSIWESYRRINKILRNRRNRLSERWAAVPALCSTWESMDCLPPILYWQWRWTERTYHLRNLHHCGLWGHGKTSEKHSSGDDGGISGQLYQDMEHLSAIPICWPFYSPPPLRRWRVNSAWWPESWQATCIPPLPSMELCMGAWTCIIIVMQAESWPYSWFCHPFHHGQTGQGKRRIVAVRVLGCETVLFIETVPEEI